MTIRKLVSSTSLPAAVQIVEVGPRDGLQNEPQFVATEHKVQLIQQLFDAGLARIEATSFVSPKWVPSMKDASEVMDALNQWTSTMSSMTSSTSQSKERQLDLSVLVPNLQGFHRAVKAGASSIAIFASASEAFSKKNINCTIDESLERFREVTEAAQQHGIPVRGYVSCVLGCPYSGFVAPSDVARVTKSLEDLGCFEISLGDTIGVGTPGSTSIMLQTVQVSVSFSVSKREFDRYSSSQLIHSCRTCAPLLETCGY